MLFNLLNKKEYEEYKRTTDELVEDISTVNIYIR